ncbi:DNA-directed RNA polymerase subunit beta [Paenibacillus macerans]|uniref:DNA-directed RNA polymerase subunit beta n=1 Tax=Paenibacillus macerans TaxID=44252 RepID=UPI003D31148F
MTEENHPVAGRSVAGRSAWIIILRIVIILLILFLALAGGTVVGYVVFGHREMSDIWDLATWRHVFDLVFAP